MDPTNLVKRSTPYYALKQREAFLGGANGQLPPFNTDPEQLEKKAHEMLTKGGWLYVASNAGMSLTAHANREAFYRWRILPRMLVDTNERDLSVELFGRRIPSPICIAPIGLNGIYNPLGELAPAKVAGELGIPYSLSSAGTKSIESVGKANGEGNPRMFQLYLPHDKEIGTSMLQRAWDSGFDVCMFTVDTWQLGWRHDDIANGNYAPYRSWQNVEIGVTDPVFQKRLAEKGIVPGRSLEDDKAAGTLWIDTIWHGKAHTWETATWAMTEWKRITGGKPFLIKGIQTVPDARKCVELGFDGVVVSNHAGRQVDGAVASLDQLADIIDAIGKTPNFTILFDSGIRGAADVFKAVALGAHAVLIGRLYIWGLSIAGETGVRHVLESLLADLDILLNCAGYRSFAEVDRSAIKLVEHGHAPANRL